MPAVRAEIGVIGGSGFYTFLRDVSEEVIETPYGQPSAPIAVGTAGGRRVAFLPRHGVGHTYPPHQVNYRANLWALAALGVRRIIGPCAAGSLQAGIKPGDFVVLDQLVDRTWGRSDTYVEAPVVEHVSYAEPYCPELGRVVVAAAAGLGGSDLTVHPTGTVVVVQGPRFSTKAESAWYRSAGWQVISMTQYPEAYLARELGLCYAGVALITDYDAGLEGVDGIEAVTMQTVLAMVAGNVERTRGLLLAAIPEIPIEPGCDCRQAAVAGPYSRRG